jgi:predicted short-subunit dehydrogenase-like oxidoreductase (DUF2520 family)
MAQHSTSSLGPLAVFGAGACAQHLGLELVRRGLDLRLCARNEKRAAELAETIRRAVPGASAVAVESCSEALAGASALLVCVSDDSLAEVASDLARELRGKRAEGAQVALHTSGFHGAAILDPLAERGFSTGAMHPLMPFPQADADRGAGGVGGAGAAGEAWFRVSGSKEAVAFAEQLVARIGGKVLALPADADGRAYHAGAALLSNGTVALYDCALELFARAGAQRAQAHAALCALLAATHERIERLSTPAALTGPVVRGDAGVVAGHVHALSGEQGRGLLDLYRALARRMIEMGEARGDLDHLARARLEHALQAED